MEVEKLIACQAELFENIKRAEANYKKTPKERMKQSYIETRLELLEELWKQFGTQHRNIVSCTKDKEREPYFSEETHNQCEEIYIQYKTSLREALRKYNSQHQTSTAAQELSATGNVNFEVKLPRVQLPTFSGKYEEWQSFLDIFSTLIHNNVSLSPGQKLQYLKTNLTGEPSSLLSNFSTTDANYIDAWNLLVRRYDNKRYNCTAILRKLFEQRNITSESSSDIKHLLDNTSCYLNALSNMGIETKSWDIIIIHIITSKLDIESVKLWEHSLSTSNDALPTWSQLKEFMESRFRSLEMISTNTAKRIIQPKVPVKPKSYHVSEESKPAVTCVLCQGEHHIYTCEKFIKLIPKDRQQFVLKSKLCFNCLAPSHTVYKCYNRTNCKKCTKRHHTLLHFDKECPESSAPASHAPAMRAPASHVPARHVPAGQPLQTIPEEVNVSTNFTNRGSEANQVLLATASIKVPSHNYILRTLIDQGSQATFITENTVQLLGLAHKPVSGWVSGLGDGRIRIKRMVSLSLQSCHDASNVIHINAYVIKSLNSILPTPDFNLIDWSDINNLPLADSICNGTGSIDLLLGADVYSEILLEGVLKHPTRNIIAQNTIFGWIVSGKVSHKRPKTTNNVISMHINVESEQDILRKFSEMEDEPQQIEKQLSTSERKCEDYYNETTTRDTSGRFVVKLPFSTDEPQCVYNNSKNAALKRLEHLEKRLNANEELKNEYHNVMREYIHLNHLTEVPENKINEKSVYLPHHAVVRNDKSTTKVRIVFDASCKGDNNTSLNDDLLVGPKLQQDLRHILMRWRLHRVVVVGDIVKMYRMILIHENETDYQRIVWRFNSDDPVQHYKLLRLTFGTACAPYLAVKCLQRLATENAEKYPLAAIITKLDFFVDDLISGGECTEELIIIHREMTQMMSEGGFILQKWNSNDMEFLKYLDSKENNKDTEKITTEFKGNNITKVLGVGWNRETDTFEYIPNLPDQIEYTKREIISYVARLYDPLGWIAPIIIMAKVLIQSLWKSNLQWDDKLTEDLMREWISFRSSLSQLNQIQIPRWVNTGATSNMQLHTFSDASTTGYAGAIYLRVVDDNEQVHVHLITAKTKVAPLKNVSIPRLELCGAVLAANLIHEVAQILGIQKKNCFGWTDSTIVLAWLKGGPSRWATFVSNRVSTILNILEYEQWSHVASENNPADVASRGASTTNLIHNQLWWTGPMWLSQPTFQRVTIIEDTNEEERIKVLTVCAPEKEYVWSKFSDLKLALRVISYCRRVLNLKLPLESRKTYPKFITVEEMNESTTLCIKQVQDKEFSTELEQLKKGGNVSRKGNLYTLCPILDENGILRVGGRITQSDAAYDTRHPIILPAKNHFTWMLILDAHRRTLHGGPLLMSNFLRTKYWIVRGKLEVKRIYRECVTCRRHSSRHNTQLMGQIPEARLKPSKPFKSTGVDYAGPINIRFSPGRGSKSYKGYICLFVCMVTRAVHIEAVSDLSAKGFLAAFRRFTARRGHCQDLYSDNGTNFVGASKVLKEMFHQCNSSLTTEVANALALEGTHWHFIPPHAPNFGGLWEAGVRSTKQHLYRVIGKHTLTYEELATLLTQVEACLNSRPISILSDNPNDPLPLTPGHFLIGEPIINLADSNHDYTNVTGLERWKLIQKIVKDFWNRWYKEYLVTLNQRYKWNCKTNEPKLNDIVVLKEDNIPPAKWLIGKIIEKHPGPDNLTRVVTVQCKNGKFKRPLNKICILCE